MDKLQKYREDIKKYTNRYGFVVDRPNAVGSNMVISHDLHCEVLARLGGWNKEEAALQDKLIRSLLVGYPLLSRTPKKEYAIESWDNYCVVFKRLSRYYCEDWLHYYREHRGIINNHDPGKFTPKAIFWRFGPMVSCVQIKTGERPNILKMIWTIGFVFLAAFKGKRDIESVLNIRNMLQTAYGDPWLKLVGKFWRYKKMKLSGNRGLAFFLENYGPQWRDHPMIEHLEGVL